jgi:hypothetical protein
VCLPRLAAVFLFVASTSNTAGAAAGSTATAKEQTTVGVVQATVTTAAPIYVVPETGRQPLRVFAVGSTVKVLKEDGAWVQVEFSDSQLGPRVGWMEAKFIEVSRPLPIVEARPTAPGDVAVAQVPDAPVPEQPKVTASARDAMRGAPSAAAAQLAEQHLTGSPATMKGAPPEDDVRRALAIGAAAKGGRRGLVLRDTGQGVMQAMTAFSNAYGSGSRQAEPSSGFWVEAWTPLSWVEQQSSNAAKQYRTLTTGNVAEEAMLEPVFRVVVHPDTPNEVSRAGMSGTSSVEHVVLRSQDRKIVIQPLSLEPFNEEAQNAMGAKVVFQGVMAQFSLAGLATVRGVSGEFFITVIGAGREEKNFKVKPKHFSSLR